MAGLADLGDEKRAGTHPWKSSQPNRGVESGGKETSPGNSSLGDTHTLSGFHHALYLTGMGLSLYLLESQPGDPKMAELERTTAILQFCAPSHLGMGKPGQSTAGSGVQWGRSTAPLQDFTPSSRPRLVSIVFLCTYLFVFYFLPSE